MKAYFSHGTYHLFVDPQNLTSLYRGELEAELQDHDTKETLDKKVILVKDLSGQGDVQYNPPDADWSGLKEIRVLLSKESLEHLAVAKTTVQRIPTGNVHIAIEDTSDFV